MAASKGAKKGGRTGAGWTPDGSDSDSSSSSDESSGDEDEGGEGQEAGGPASYFTQSQLVNLLGSATRSARDPTGATAALSLRGYEGSDDDEDALPPIIRWPPTFKTIFKTCVMGSMAFNSMFGEKEQAGVAGEVAGKLEPDTAGIENIVAGVFGPGVGGGGERDAV